tara:strand:+ start:242 stop:1306 length:1065 start_codon:yes stop_codon:yes gene_type:complete
MPYLNIPESKVTEGVAKLVGELQGQLSDKVYTLVNDSIQKIRREACPNLPSAQRLVQKTQAVSNSINGISNRVSKFKKLASTIMTLIKVINIIVKLIKKLPVPQAVPPGIGLPVGFSMIQGDLLHAAKEKIKQGKDDAEGILAVVKTPEVNLKMYGKILSRVSLVANGCRLEGLLRREVNEGKLREQTLRDLNIINDRGEYVFSNVGANLFDSLDFDRAGNVREYNKFTENKVDKDKIQKDSEDNFLDALTKLDASSEISDEIKDTLKSVLDSVVTTEDKDVEDSSDLNYTASNGIVYTLVIEIDPTSPSIAPRRFAVARTPQGAIALKGPKSFSSSTKILLDELKFRLDNQLP